MSRFTCFHSEGFPVVITGMTEAVIRELAEGIGGDPAHLPAALAKRIADLEGVRVEVKRVDAAIRAEHARHRDALAALGAELDEWRRQCPHPRAAQVSSSTFCSVCGYAVGVY
jgi:hypothetical protein